MGDIAIRIENLSKQYTIGATRARHDSLRDHLADGLKSLFSRNGLRSSVLGQSSTFWALKDISFEVKRGEVVGIIGRNGAGKSTLLKILSRITEPTSGYAELHGRVGSLLEVGTGFDRELTGRENVYLNGAILGMKKTEIERKFDEIVDFSGVEKFIDTPVKRYSSGMYVRLAFAVAAHLEPEILIVDEVLAVGDGAFQKKCLGKMSDVSKAGRTVLFVSHNMQAVNTLCGRGVFLNEGGIEKIGPTAQVVASYLQTTAPNPTVRMEQLWPDPQTAPGNGNIRLRHVVVRSQDAEDCLVFDLRTTILVEIEYWQLKPTRKTYFDLVLYTTDGTCVLNSYGLAPEGSQQVPGLYRAEVEFPAPLLNSGEYRVRLQFLDEDFQSLYEQPELAFFSIHDANARDIPWHQRFWGVIHPDLKWRALRLD